MQVVCAIVFCVFSFVYLFCFQTDILAVAQHVLSKGMTHYNRLIGSIIITFVLQLLQLGIYALTKLHRRTHALTYFPSILLLLIITDINQNIDLHFSFGAWIWVFPLLIVLYVLVLFLMKKIQPYEPDVSSKGLFSRMMWINILQMCVMFFFLGCLSNSNDLFHYRMKAEHCLLDKDYTGALEVGVGTMKTDSSLTMLKIYALSRQNQLGEHLFEYPLVGRSKALLPNGITVKSMMYPLDSIYSYLGAKPLEKLSPMTYLHLLVKRNMAKKPVGDYILVGYLLDKDLNGFVRELPRYYNINERLPKHYREALILYTHLRANPTIIFHSTVMDQDFQDMQDLENKYTNKILKKRNIKSQYSNTYWYYYKYE